MDHVYTHWHGKISQYIIVGGSDSLQTESHGMKRTICATFERHTHSHSVVHGYSCASMEVGWKDAAEGPLHIRVSSVLFRHSFTFCHCKRESHQNAPQELADARKSS